jgi:hypothetical protein
MLDDVELRELLIFLAVLDAGMRETGAQRPGAGVRAGCPLPWPASPPATRAWPHQQADQDRYGDCMLAVVVSTDGALPNAVHAAFAAKSVPGRARAADRDPPVTAVLPALARCFPLSSDHTRCSDTISVTKTMKDKLIS